MPSRFLRSVRGRAARTIAVLALLRFAAPAAAAPADTTITPVPPADSSAVAVHADTLEWTIDAVAALIPRGNAGTEAAAGARIEPSGIVVDAFGRVVVADAAQHRLLRYDERGVFVGEAGSLGSDDGHLRRPGSVVLLGTLGVGVLDVENRRVVAYDLFGRFQGVTIDLEADELVAVTGRVDPVALAADRGGAVALADADQDRVLVFDFSGRYLRRVGGFGARPGSFRALRGVAYTRRGELVTAERGGARIQRLDGGGRVLASWAIPVGPSRLGVPVAVDDSGRVAVADEATGRLWLHDANGRLLAFRDGLAGPRALAFDRDGSLLVAEAAGGRVRRWSFTPRAEPPARGRE